MSLAQFDIRGEEIANDETGEILRKGDPSRSLMRYRPDGGELYIHSRVNMALLRAAVRLPILLLKPVSREDEVTPPSKLQIPPEARLLTPQGSIRNYTFLEDL